MVYGAPESTAQDQVVNIVSAAVGHTEFFLFVQILRIGRLYLSYGKNCFCMMFMSFFCLTQSVIQLISLKYRLQ